MKIKSLYFHKALEILSIHKFRQKITFNQKAHPNIIVLRRLHAYYILQDDSKQLISMENEA